MGIVYDHEWFLDKCMKNRDDMDEYEILGRYKNTSTKIKAVHKNCGEEFLLLPSTFGKGKAGCPECRKEKMRKRFALTHKEFMKRVRKAYGGNFKDYEIVGEYVNQQTLIPVKHIVCGEVYDRYPKSLLDGRGCLTCSGYKKKTDKQYREEIQNLVGDEYVFLDEYINARTKIRVRHNSEDCDNHEYLITPNDFLSGYRCPHNSHLKTPWNKKTQKDFEKEVADIGDGYKLVGKYENAQTKVTILHDKCKYLWSVTPHNFLRGNRCPRCYGAERFDLESFKNRIKSMVGDEYHALGDYRDRKITMVHNKCGKKYRIEPWLFTKGIRCSSCHGGIKLTHSQFMNRLKERCGEEFTPKEEYKNAITEMSFIHNICGREFVSTPNRVLSGQGCNICNMSRGERKIMRILNEIGAAYEMQYRDIRCKRKRALPFDFAVFEGSKLSALIEYDGHHHFEIGHFCNTEEDLEEIRERDEIKNRFSEDYKIPLLRIPYWDFDNVENILLDFLSENKIKGGKINEYI